MRYYSSTALLQLLPLVLFDRELALGPKNDFVVVVVLVLVVLCHHLVKFTYECLINALNGLNCASKICFPIF